MKLDTMPDTVRWIFESYEKARKNEHRPHLGGSQIGIECSRALWYQFRHCERPQFDGRMLRLFETGDLEENRIVANLRAIGVTVWDRDPETGKQIRFSGCDGHFALSLDGVGEGFPESKRPHTLEFKTMSDKNFKAMHRDGLEKSKPVYWAQCHVGMHLSGIDRCAFIAVNKNTDEIYYERVRYDAAIGIKLTAKAESIIFADTPPSRISNDPSYFVCKFCVFSDICHKAKPPEVNCRTCAHATPERGGDGLWSCALGKEMVTCQDHLYNPYAMGWEVHDAGTDWVEYMTPDGEIIRNQRNSTNVAMEWVPM